MIHGVSGEAAGDVNSNSWRGSQDACASLKQGSARETNRRPPSQLRSRARAAKAKPRNLLAPRTSPFERRRGLERGRRARLSGRSRARGRDAGARVFSARRGDSAQVESKAGGSPVTEADLAADALLKQRLGEAFPDAGWLSEETADDPERLDRRTLIVVDPIDGTRAFVAGDPRWAVSAALVVDGRPFAGVVHAPALDETYTAARGSGAELNGAALAVRTSSDRSRLSAAGPKSILRSPGRPASGDWLGWDPRHRRQRVAHGGQVDHARHAGEILQQHARRHEADLFCPDDPESAPPCATYSTSSAETRRPSSNRSRFSSRILVENGKRATWPTPFSSRLARRKYSYSVPPARSFAAAPKLLVCMSLIIMAQPACPAPAAGTALVACRARMSLPLRMPSLRCTVAKR